ncbi:hypothetical protein KFK09_002754 [Dendrobium nobile]|uniref:Reverse transcriptase zinc-binding domain-containing protein n=1 Tax=Dendrobium nobile TaxID=94219 RepID=A0A8T3C811_DENNO|nr:hypothetical protein KFK09_002754 [Dendrobium nobile]
MHRRLINYNGCPRGCNKVEDAEHIVVNCYFIHEVIKTINKWGFSIPILPDLSCCFKELTDMSNSNIFLANLYCSAIFLTWKSRNKFVHGNKKDTYNIIAANALSFTSSSINYDHITVSWDYN